MDNELVRLLAELLSGSNGYVLSSKGTRARIAILKLAGVRSFDNEDTIREGIKKYLETTATPSDISFSSGTYFEAQRILERLRSGDRLIAFTAGGVSWLNAYYETPPRYEFPDGAALQYLINSMRLSSRDAYSVNGFVNIAMYELVETPDAED